MHNAKRLIPVVGLFLAAACADSLTQPDAPSAGLSGRPADPSRWVTVMTRNAYVGADVDAVIRALASPDPADDFPALMAAIGTLQATDFPLRAGAIADEIARARPHVVGLQEVYELKVDLTALGVPVNINLDFLAILQAALAQRHLPYDVAARVRNTEAVPFPGISLVDFDVVLVDRERVTVEPGVVASQYAYNIGPVAPGVDIRRGYIVLRAAIGGRTVTIANTHLESGEGIQLGMLRAAQATELASVIGSASSAIVMGDLNDVPGSPMSQVLASAGLEDSWARFAARDAGLTCCHAADLSNPLATFTQRIDYVWARGFEMNGRGLEGRAELVGEARGDRIAGPAGPIWPSDHAGLVAEVRLVR